MTERPLYVYALLRGRGRARPGVGLAGEPLRVVEVSGLHVVVGPVRRRPPPSAAALQRHDQVVRRLTAGAAAVLPVRFGTLVADAEALARALAPRAPELGRALDLVRGCHQMTLRISRRTPAGNARDAAPSAVGGGLPGTRYLTERLRARQVPEIAPLQRALRPVVRAERVERHDRPPWLASVYHLVPRGDVERYAAIVAAAGPRLPELTIATSGPWPAWAFAPEAVA